MKPTGLWQRWKGYTVHFSSREVVLLVGYANLVGKSVARTIADIVMMHVMEFDANNPGLLLQEARKVLDKQS